LNKDGRRGAFDIIRRQHLCRSDVFGPEMLMVLGADSSKGDVMPPHIFEAGLKINSEVYLDVFTTAA